MALSTYDDLKASVAAWLARDDLTESIPDFITLAEGKINRKLRVRSMIKRATASASTTVRYLALPTGFLDMRILRFLTTPVHRPLFTSEDDITTKLNSASGKPEWYTIHEEIEFDRVCDSSYSVEMIYYARLTALGASNQSNGVLTQHPDIYLKGALSEAEPYLDNDERIATWRDDFMAAMDAANNAHRKSMAGSAMAARPIGKKP